MKQLFTRLTNLDAAQNELLRKAFNQPELTPVVTSVPTTQSLKEGQFQIYNDGTNQYLYTRVGDEIVNFQFGSMISAPENPTTGQYLYYDGNSWEAVDLDLPTYSQLFASSGTFTAPDGVTQVMVTMVGGGGGGGADNNNNNSGGGAGSGAYVIRYGLTVTPLSDYSVTVGAKGVGATGTAVGGTGGDSIFPGDNVTITCKGGVGGQTNKIAGTGGAATGTDGTGSAGVGATGGAGGVMNVTTAGKDGGVGDDDSGGGGAGSPFGKGGKGGDNGQAGADATGFGAGGGGGAEDFDGGDGSGGMVYLEW